MQYSYETRSPSARVGGRSVPLSLASSTSKGTSTIPGPVPLGHKQALSLVARFCGSDRVGRRHTQFAAHRYMLWIPFYLLVCIELSPISTTDHAHRQARPAVKLLGPTSYATDAERCVGNAAQGRRSLVCLCRQVWHCYGLDAGTIHSSRRGCASAPTCESPPCRLLADA